MLRVLIADDHDIVRKGIRQILLEEYAEAEIGEASDTNSLVEKAITEKWDIIISDLAMPGGGGLEGLSRIRAKLPFQRILIISIYPEEQYAIRVMKSGASGFLNKDTAHDELITAINCILSGRRYIQPSLSETMAAILQIQAGILAHELLNEPEFQILKLLGKGLNVTQIASQLTLPSTDVSNHRSRILKKMALKTNEDLIRYSKENQIVK